MSKRQSRGRGATAAVVLPELPIQLVWRTEARWRGAPIAVVADVGPQALVTHLSPEARKRGLREGLTQGVARNLVPDLRTRVVSMEERARLMQDLAKGLQLFSPRVAIEERFEGCFTVDPRGLGPLFGGQAAWAQAVHAYLDGRGLRASVAVGRHRYRTLVAAHGQTGPMLLSEEVERRRSDERSLRSLGVPEKIADPLAMLGVQTLGELLALPPGELETRFGREIRELHDLFAEQEQLPMQPLRFEMPRRRARELLPPRSTREALTGDVEALLDELVTEVAARGEVVEALHFEMHLERHGARRLDDEERVVRARLEPAEPTVHVPTLFELVSLRLDETELAAAVEGVALEAEVRAAHGHQLEVPTGDGPRRDLHGAARALARLRATHGSASVVRFVKRDAHLPEAQSRFEPLPVGAPLVAKTRPSPKRPAAADTNHPLLRVQGTKPELRPPPEPATGSPMASSDPVMAPLARRLRARPLRLNAGPRPELPEEIVALYGPHRVAGGWWGAPNADGSVRSTERTYFYAEGVSGRMHYVYQTGGVWFLHGTVD